MTHNSQNGTLKTVIDNKIATVEFGHPAGNSFPATLLRSLAEAIKTLGNDNEVTIIILRSSGSTTFCAGASFDELLAVSNLEEGNTFFCGFANLINAMRKCPKLIIGRIQGKTVGGGVGIAAACDYALATSNAAIKLSELAIGIGPFVIEPAVTRKIGKTAMSEMALEAHDWKNASWAMNKGLYANVFEDIKDLDEAISSLCSKLSSYNPEALYQMKKVFWEGTEHWETLLYERAAISGRLVLSDFTINALESFKK